MSVCFKFPRSLQPNLQGSPCLTDLLWSWVKDKEHIDERKVQGFSQLSIPATNKQ